MKTSLLDFAGYVLVITLALAGFYFMIKLPRNIEVRYNCELAEISPDVPVKVKQQCRELKAKL